MAPSAEGAVDEGPQLQLREEAQHLGAFVYCRECSVAAETRPSAENGAKFIHTTVGTKNLWLRSTMRHYACGLIRHSCSSKSSRV